MKTKRKTNTDPQYTPTPDDIRLACESIRESWTDEILYRRAGSLADKPAEMPFIRVADMGIGAKELGGPNG